MKKLLLPKPKTAGAAVCLLLSLSACKKEEGDGTKLVVSRSEITLDERNRASLVVECNTYWSYRSDVSWLPSSNILADKEPGKTTLDITADPNGEYVDRTGTIEFRAGNRVKKVTVTQPKNLGLILFPSAYDHVPPGGQTLTVRVKSNVEYEVFIPEENSSWIARETGTKGRLEESELRFRIAPHTGNTERRGKIAVTDKKKGVSDTIRITQAFPGKEIVIKDKDFRKYCLDHYDADLNGKLTAEEAQVPTEMTLSGFRSLSGLENFTSLKTLTLTDCDLNYLNLAGCTDLKRIECRYTSPINLKATHFSAPSAEVYVSSTRLTFIYFPSAQFSLLDVNGCPYLESLSLTSNHLSSVKVDRCTALKKFYFDASENNYSRCLSSLDLDNNTQLEELGCRFTDLTSLDINRHPRLRYLYCAQNYKLTELKLAGHNNLNVLSLSDNPELKSITWGTLPKLSRLICNQTPLTQLDLTGLPALEYLSLNRIPVTALNLSGNRKLTELHCSFTRFKELDLSKNPDLTRILCTDNLLEKLVLGEKNRLTYLDCSHNKLAALDLSGCPKATQVNCRYNVIKVLDLAYNTELNELYAESNLLTALDLTKNPRLQWLYCSANPLRTLDLSGNEQLYGLFCYGTKLKSLDLSYNHYLSSLNVRGKDVNSPLSTVYVWAGFKMTDYPGWKVPDGTVFREKN